MNKKAVLVTLVSLVPGLVLAAGENNVGSCGLGSKVFDGQEGIFPQVLAVTTNSTFGNQTFGITSGTLGCTQDGVVKSNWAAVLFIDGNQRKLAHEMAIGRGETLESLAKVIGVQQAHKAVFFRTTKENYAKIFTSPTASSQQIATELKRVLAADRQLAQYVKAI